jgi:hypothetical protein
MSAVLLQAVRGDHVPSRDNGEKLRQVSEFFAPKYATAHGRAKINEVAPTKDAPSAAQYWSDVATLHAAMVGTSTTEACQMFTKMCREFVGYGGDMFFGKVTSRAVCRCSGVLAE